MASLVFAAIMAAHLSAAPSPVQEAVPCSSALAEEALASAWNLDFGPGIYRSCDLGVTPGTTPGPQVSPTKRTCAEEDQLAARMGWVIAPLPSGVVRTCDTGVTAPVGLSLMKPQYTPEAMRRRIEGIAIVGAVIGPDGFVERAQILTSLDKVYGLDQQALEAVKSSQFTPAKKDGKPVAAFDYFELQFKLR